VPQVTANAGWRYRLNEYWRVRYNALYTGQRYASDDVLNEGRQLSAYWLHSAAVQFIYQSLEVSFSVENLFNQTFPAYTLFNADSNTNTYYPGAGRSYLLTLKWNIE
jgi:outer membrane receptor protein involved in Fe transport